MYVQEEGCLWRREVFSTVHGPGRDAPILHHSHSVNLLRRFLRSLLQHAGINEHTTAGRAVPTSLLVPPYPPSTTAISYRSTSAPCLCVSIVAPYSPPTCGATVGISLLGSVPSMFHSDFPGPSPPPDPSPENLPSPSTQLN